MPTPEPVLLSWSGGKDSSLSLAALCADPDVRVVGLLTTITAGLDRIAVHGVRRSLLRDQADSAGLPLYEASIPAVCRNDDYEQAMGIAFERVRREHPALRRVAFGDLFLEDIRRYREDRLGALGLEAVFPVWGRDTRALADDFIAAGYRARLVCVDTQQLSADFVGRELDRELLRELPDGVDPCGENGEFHTFVSDGPVFRRPVPYRLGERMLRDDRFAHQELLEPAGAA
jgi:uncharacterized protein (TIGR00290 family)